MRNKSRSNSLQSRLIGIMVLMLALTLLINLFLNFEINRMVRKIDSVFASNVTMDELTEIIGAVEDSVYEYLNTKSSAALENYYRYSQDYRDILDEMNDQNAENEVLMLEKNIRCMSESYLEKAEETVQAKRGRNVERYRACYDETADLYGYINYYIYQLNRLYFTNNSDSYEQLLGVMTVLERMSIVVILIVFAFCLLMVTMIIRAIVHPLRELSDTALKVAEGDLEVAVPVVESNDEIGIVASAFSKMLESIRVYIARVKESIENEARMKEQELAMEANLKEAQLQFLQAQINPHFLFNSLNAGAQLAMMEDAENTGSFLEKMADFFRYNVKKNNGDSTLSEEIQSVDNYIYILNVRFAGDITYVKNIAEGVDDLPMPGLILQPLVENAVSHGIHDMMDRGVISLSVEREDSLIRVSVMDNGIGMTADRISSVMNENVHEGDSTGIGLGNVMNRLKLYYGRDDLFSIHSDGPGCGTEVTILLPQKEGSTG